jgi:hypothetical protein
MNEHTPLPWPLAASDRLYQRLLVVCPRAFRRAFGAEMADVFADCCAEAWDRGGWPALLLTWPPAFWDLISTAALERLAGAQRGDEAHWAMPGLALAPSLAGDPTGDDSGRTEMPRRNTMTWRLKRMIRRLRPAPYLPVGHLDLHRFTDRARTVLALAREEARGLRHNFIGTEHLLLGLIREDDGVAARALDELGVSADAVRGAVLFIIGRGDHVVAGEVPLTARAKLVLQLASDEARGLNHSYIGTEHLLLALIREGNGIAAGVLEGLGVDHVRARARILAILGDEGEDRDGDSPDRA